MHDLRHLTMGEFLLKHTRTRVAAASRPQAPHLIVGPLAYTGVLTRKSTTTRETRKSSKWTGQAMRVVRAVGGAAW